MIALEPHERQIVQDILRRLVPERAVMVFGSRGRGKAKPFSDLDLAIMGEAPVPFSVRNELAEAFDESDLPFKVDLADWAGLSESFRAEIGPQLVLLVAPESR